jgi:hypothetical protein
LRPLCVRGSGVGKDGAKEASGQRGVDAFERLEENQAERVSMGEKPIAAGIWKLSDETFGPKLGEVIAEGGERIAVGRASKCLDDVGLDFRSCKVTLFRKRKQQQPGSPIPDNLSLSQTKFTGWVLAPRTTASDRPPARALPAARAPGGRYWYPRPVPRTCRTRCAATAPRGQSRNR